MVRYLRFIVLLPIGLAILGLALLNRAAVKLTYWPEQFGGELSLNVPLFFALIVALMVGIVTGSFTTWLTQGGHRRAERQYRREAERLKTESERLRGTQSGAVQPNAGLGVGSGLALKTPKIR